jgi:hypothetical protein
MPVHAPPPGPPGRCLRELPRALVPVPVPVALDAGCALLVLEPGGRMRLRPRPRVSYPPGWQAAPGEGVVLRGRRVTWVRDGRVIWRSRATFTAGMHRGTFTRISGATSSGRRLAYVVSRWSGRPRTEHRLVFVTRSDGPERRVATASYPLGWTPQGVVMARTSVQRAVLRVWRADGRPAAPALAIPAAASTWDWSAGGLYAAARGRLVRSDGVVVTRLASLRALGFGVSAPLQITVLRRGVIELASASHLALVDRRGRELLDASLPAGWRLSGSIAATPGGGVAYEATTGSTTASAVRFRLYAALAGGRPRLLGGYALPPSCGGHWVEVRGSAVLVSASDTFARAYDIRGTRPAADLAPVMRWLRARHRSGDPRLV